MRGGCLSAIAAALLLIVLVILFSSGRQTHVEEIRNRTPLAGTTELDWNDMIEDRLGWFSDGDAADEKDSYLSGANSFFQLTGVQPAILITDNIQGIDISEQSLKTDPNDVYNRIDKWLSDYYTDRFGADGSRMVLLYVEFDHGNGYFVDYIYAGSAAMSVIDNEAIDIVLTYIDQYFSSNRNEGELFGDALADSAKEIMQGNEAVQKAAAAKKDIAIVLAVLGIAVIGTVVIKIVLRHKQKIKEENAKILNSDISDLLEEKSEAEQYFSEKYNDSNNN